jgi:hypothetical protein
MPHACCKFHTDQPALLPEPDSDCSRQRAAVQLGQYIRSAAITRILPDPPDARLDIARPVSDGNPDPWAVTILDASFLEGGPARLHFVNTTGWCAQTEALGEVVIEQALTVACEEGVYNFATNTTSGGGASACGEARAAAGGGGGWAPSGPRRPAPALMSARLWAPLLRR